nr:hypothetical protein [Tanacetum cinerariifolium]
MISKDTLIDFHQIVLWIFMETSQKPTNCCFSRRYKAVKVRSNVRIKGIVPIEMELELEQSQQGSSHEVSFFITSVFFFIFVCLCGEMITLSLLNDDLVRRDPSIPGMNVASILEGFIDKPPLEENGDLFDLEPKNDEWKKILYDAQIDDLMFEDKIFDPEIHDQNFPQHMSENTILIPTSPLFIFLI